MAEAVRETRPHRSQRESDTLDRDLISWWLLHRSELNALSLNRLVESLRGDDDALLIPPRGRIRSLLEYRVEVTLQFAIELALGDPHLRAELDRRPHLRQPAMDAAYYISRQRLGSFQRADEKASVFLDLSDSAEDDFQRYLVHRMNLYEEEASPDKERKSAWYAGTDWQREKSVLADKDLQLLLALPRSIAATLANSATGDQLKSRWQECARQQREGTMSSPSDAVHDALLVGSELSLLIPLPAAVRSGSLYAWRDYTLATRGADTLQAIALASAEARAEIEVAETALIPLLLAHDDVDPDNRQVLQSLAEEYRVLPTTPAWSQVQAARNNLLQAVGNVGNVASLQTDLELLREYAKLLSQPDTISAVCRLLSVAGAVAAFTRSDMAVEAFRPALGVLSEGLRFSSLSIKEIDQRLSEFEKGFGELLQTREPLPRAGARGLATWPDANQLTEAVVAARAVGLRVAGNKEFMKSIVAQAWASASVRLSDPDGQHLADLAEVLCAMSLTGPGGIVTLNLEAMTPRHWTRALGSSLRPDAAAQIESNVKLWVQVLLRIWRGLKSWDALLSKALIRLIYVMSPSDPLSPLRPRASAPVWLLTHALPALGMHALHAEANRRLLEVLERSHHSPEQVAAALATQRSWMGAGRNTECVLLVTDDDGSVSDGWRVPPTRGLLLVADVDDAVELIDGLVGAWLKRIARPLRVVWEAQKISPRKEDTLRWKLRTRLSLSQYREFRLQRHELSGPTDHPAMPMPRTPDDLWR